MKEFLRILTRFVPPYKKFLALNIFFNLLTAFLTLFSFALIIPILQILFKVTEPVEADFIAWSAMDSGNAKEVLMNNVQYYMNEFVSLHGASMMLLLLGLFLVFMTLLKTASYFASSAAIIPLRTGIVRDLRTMMYDKIVSLPLGFFSKEKKGDGTLVANSLLNYIIYDVNATINVDPSALVSYEVNMNNGEEVLDWSGSNKITFGDGGEFERDPFRKHTFSAVASVSLKGGIDLSNISASKDFHLTGLPLEADFSYGAEAYSGWHTINGSFDGSCVLFGESGTSGLRSPAIYLPTGSLNVKTQFDGCSRAMWGSGGDEKRDVYFIACAANEESVKFGSNVIRAHHNTDHPGAPGGYLGLSPKMTLTNSTPSLMASKNTQNCHA